jgi:hypothetical protein
MLRVGRAAAIAEQHQFASGAQRRCACAHQSGKLLGQCGLRSPRHVRVLGKLGTEKR